VPYCRNDVSANRCIPALHPSGRGFLDPFSNRQPARLQCLDPTRSVSESQSSKEQDVKSPGSVQCANTREHPYATLPLIWHRAKIAKSKLQEPTIQPITTGFLCPNSRAHPRGSEERENRFVQPVNVFISVPPMGNRSDTALADHGLVFAVGPFERFSKPAT
jgi:hypothetical protein